MELRFGPGVEKEIEGGFVWAMRIKKRMKPDTWMPLYPGDYLRDTMHLDAEGHGAYLLLILAYWSNGGPIPANEDWLRNVCRVREASWMRIKGMVLPFFKEEAGTLRHKRVDDELAKAQSITEARSRAGKLGSNALLSKRSANAEQTPGKGQANAEQTSAPSPSPSHKRESSGDEGDQQDDGNAEIPSLTEIKAYGSMHGITPDVCQSFYDHHEGNRLWLNMHGVAINWKHKLSTWQNNSRQNATNNTKPGSVSSQRPDRNAGTYNKPEGQYSKLVR